MTDLVAMATKEGPQSGNTKESINDLKDKLGIEVDDLDDLIFEDEEETPKEGMKWTSLVRIHTDNPFSPQTFEQHMRNAWSPTKEVIFTALEPNLFTVQCFCVGDWLKIEQGGPWFFRQHAVFIEPYDGFTGPETIDLNSLGVWIQIHKLPLGYRNTSLITNLVNKQVGRTIAVQTNVQGAGNFVRVHVKVDVRKVTARVVSISRGGQRELYQIKYEKYPRFCGACGFLGHTYLEWGTGEHGAEKLKWGNFLKADWGTWRGRGIGGNRGGSSMGSGARRGRDPSGRGYGPAGRGDVLRSWRHNALPLKNTDDRDEDPLNDTGSSPIKESDTVMKDKEALDPNARKRLLMGMDGDYEIAKGVNLSMILKQ
jgi:hypothetical protein